LAIVLLLSVVNYGLWNWSLGAGHDLIALVAGLALIPLLIALAWLLLVSVTRFAGDTARRLRASAAARADASPTLRGRTKGSPAGASAAATRRTSAESSSARNRRAAPSADDEEAAAAAAASSSKLAA
jgi:uncharacterized SAM-binding protein YcdF (DUF218 family)